MILFFCLPLISYKYYLRYILLLVLSSLAVHTNLLPIHPQHLISSFISHLMYAVFFAQSLLQSEKYTQNFI